MSRHLHKSWRDKPPSGPRTYVPRQYTLTPRIRWYVGDEIEGIRLEILDTEGTVQVFFDTKEDAQQFWDDFKAGRETSTTAKDKGRSDKKWFVDGTKTGKSRKTR